MMSKSSNKKRSFFTLITLLILVVVFNFVYSPIKEQNESLSVDVEELQAQVDALQETETATQANLQIGELEQRVVDFAIPERFDQDELIKQVANLASAHQIDVDSLSFAKRSTENQFIDSVRLSVAHSGGLFNFLEFLRTLENQQRFYEITDFSLSIGSEEPRQVTFNATIVVYHS
jgi:Tfp pilus assembly protein PilO